MVRYAAEGRACIYAVSNVRCNHLGLKVRRLSSTVSIDRMRLDYMSLTSRWSGCSLPCLSEFVMEVAGALAADASPVADRSSPQSHHTVRPVEGLVLRLDRHAKVTVLCVSCAASFLPVTESKISQTSFLPSSLGIELCRSNCPVFCDAVSLSKLRQ